MEENDRMFVIGHNENDYPIHWNVIWGVVIPFWIVCFSLTEDIWLYSLGTGFLAVVTNELKVRYDARTVKPTQSITLPVKSIPALPRNVLPFFKKSS